MGEWVGDPGMMTVCDERGWVCWMHNSGLCLERHWAECTIVLCARFVLSKYMSGAATATIRRLVNVPMRSIWRNRRLYRDSNLHAPE